MPTIRNARIHIHARPTVLQPKPDGTDMLFRCTKITATGTADLTAVETATPAGWTFGWMQAEWCETNWAYFRGQHNNDGSVFWQRGRTPARSSRACRDTITAGVPIYNDVGAGQSMILTSSTALPASLTAGHYDKPGESFPLQTTNTLTGKQNFLREAQLEFMFCAILVLISPSKHIHQLAHFYWNVRWQGTFLPTNFSNLAANWQISVNGRGQGAAASPVYQGSSNDRRFNHVIVATPTAPHCNGIAASAATNPNIRQSRVWDNFDVTR